MNQIISDESLFHKGAKETKVCGDGASHRCLGSTDQGHERPAEPAPHAAGKAVASYLPPVVSCVRGLFIIAVLARALMYSLSTWCRHLQSILRSLLLGLMGQWVNAARHNAAKLLTA